MIVPKPEDNIHKAWLFRILSGIADIPLLVEHLHFKGGTCAAMRGFIHRFSVDLDFDFIATDAADTMKVKKLLEKLFRILGLRIEDQSSKGIQYFLKYETSVPMRNTLKIDVAFPPSPANEYEKVLLQGLDRVLSCQTVETMVANKLLTLIERHEKSGHIAGRDVYDIHAFLLQGFRYRHEIIEQRRGKDIRSFLQELIDFTRDHVSQQSLDEDLNMLLPYEEFRKVRKNLKSEMLMLLMDEHKRLTQ